ncbi:MAG TPA: serine--tRNA ligase [Chthoniobacterales bacterium]|jgi:seryl-tRNA synthetase
MLDIRLLRENPELIKSRLATRKASLAGTVDAILECDSRRRKLETSLQEANGQRKRLSKEIGMLRAKGADSSVLEAEVKGIGGQIEELEAATREADATQNELLLNVPNTPHENAPIGADAEANPVVRVWGEKPKLENPIDHVRLGEKLKLFDLARATKLSGSGFVCYTGAGARLERALINFCLDLHSREHGYVEVNPPLLVKSDALVGTTQLPKFADQLYGIRDADLYLVPTAEVPVTNLHREELLSLGELPKQYVAYTPCFRSEAGAAGLGTRGLIRVHQFDKVELVKITTPEESFAELETLTANAELVLQKLGLHYRVIELCTGDLGFGSTKTYDIEVWAPGQNAYLEVSSCSNFGDFQARRMSLKYKDAEGKNRFCHTLNGSGTAMPRLFVALVETWQQPDGSVKIPEALQPYFGAPVITV